MTPERTGPVTSTTPPTAERGPVLEGGRASYITGDVRDALAAIPDGSVDLVLTSPPFLALRSYLPADHPDKHREIGAEPDPASFLATLLGLTAEFRRVLAPHGSICVELGDTYSGSGGAGGDYNADGIREGQQKFEGSNSRRGKVVDHDSGRRNPGEGWPLAKSLCGIPHLYHLSLTYGRNILTGEPCEPWRVRNVVAWCRPNPPVGALGDKFRPATSYMTIACVSGSRYFDLDAVRTAPKNGRDPNEHVGTGAYNGHERNQEGQGKPDRVANAAGAPPLDWWEIPTQPYVTPAGVLVVPSGETVRRVRVPLGADGDGIQRTASPSCPVHGSPDHQDSSGLGGGHGDSQPSRTARTDGRHGPARSGDSSPIPLTLELSDSTTATMGLEGSPAATPHSTAAHRTGPAPTTNPAGTPSAGTSPRTDDTPGQPSSTEPHPDMSASSTSADGSLGSPSHQTSGGTADTGTGPDSSEACSCSYWVEVSVSSEPTRDYAGYPPDYWDIPTTGYAGSHYAVFPPALLERPVKSMVPAKVCTTCGEPSRRIVEPTAWDHKAHPLEAEGIHAGGLGTHGDRCANPTTIGFTDCGHGGTWRPGIVLDPFAGSGTTLAVATGRGHHGIGIDLDSRNVELARDRVGPMFLDEFTLDEWKARPS